MKKRLLINMKLNQDGVSAVIVAISLLALVGVSALAIDISHLYLVKNQLQNGADAGALSGVQNLYLDDGTINPAYDTLGRDTAVLNNSDTVAVEVNLPADVQKGHWSFATHTFSPVDVPGPIPGGSFSDFDSAPNFINAVRCTTRRETTQAASFFARIFGNTGFSMNTFATAIIGTAPPLTFDVPIAICSQAITNPDGTYTCGNGRMINSSGNSTGQSGGWTNFTQGPCDTANANDVRDLVYSSKMCGGKGMNVKVNLFQGIGTVNGQQDTSYMTLYDCWRGSKSGPLPTSHVSWTLPVVECDKDGSVTSTCSTVVGAVTVDVIWMNNTTDKDYSNAPVKMDDWTCPSACTTTTIGKNGKPTTSTDGQCCWNGNGNSGLDSFIKHFGLSGPAATYQQKSIYFKPDCTAATDDSAFFSPFSKIPKLVQ